MRSQQSAGSTLVQNLLGRHPMMVVIELTVLFRELLKHVAWGQFGFSELGKFGVRTK